MDTLDQGPIAAPSLSQSYSQVRIADVIVARDTRQRRVVQTSNLKDSIARVGVIQPIIVTRSMVLVAGERRLAASKELGLSTIPARFAEDLDPIESQLIELEENFKRQDLPWRDQVGAVARLHQLYCHTYGATWTQSRTANAIGVGPSLITMYLRIQQDIDSPRIAQAASSMAAYNILARVDGRKVDDALSEIIEAGGEALGMAGAKLEGSIHNSPTGGPAPQGATDAHTGAIGAGLPIPGQPPHDPVAPGIMAPGATPPPFSIAPPDLTIIHANFLEFVDSYTGPKFNFVHCDFPYGIGAFEGSMSGRDKWTQYSDKEDVYWKLLGALCHNLDRIMAHSAHLMFWFSMEHYNKTLEFFRTYAQELDVQVFPLVWVKSDNVGVLPDPKRGPRRVYETALIGTRADRMILKPVANAYAAPTDKAHHQSTKPEPVLRHFFQMFVDSNTRILDPTCGSGSAIRAAESMGAKSCLGLEINEEHCTSARSALRSFRSLRKATQEKAS